MRRLRLWKVCVGAAVLLALSLVGLWARFELKWAAMKSLTRQLAEEAAARDCRRPSILGRDVPGNAWDDYSAGLEALKEVIEALKEPFSPVLDHKVFDLDAEAERILTALQPSFENLRQGASRAEARYPADRRFWDLGDAIPDTLPGQRWVNAAIHEQQRLRAQSDVRPAFELLLAVVQFAMDAGRNALPSQYLSSWAWLTRAREALLTLLSDPRLGSEALLEVERVAAEIERWTLASVGPALRNSVLSNGLNWGRENVGRLGGFGFEYGLNPGWRHAWSNRYLIADAVLRDADWSDRLARTVGMPLPEAERAWSELQEARSNSGNDLADRYGTGTPFDYNVYVRDLRASIAEWRLIRAAASFRRRGEVPVLDDPFGATLKSRIEGKSARIWSVGPDLRDSDGTAGDSYPEGDLVVEILR